MNRRVHYYGGGGGPGARKALRLGVGGHGTWHGRGMTGGGVLHSQSGWHGRGVAGDGILGTIWNVAKPFLSKAMGLFGTAAKSTIGKKVIESAKDNAIKSGVKLVDDVLKGENVGQSLKKNLTDTAKNTLSEGTDIVSKGLFPMKKNVKRKKKTKRSISGIKKVKKDLFS